MVTGTGAKMMVEGKEAQTIRNDKDTTIIVRKERGNEDYDKPTKNRSLATNNRKICLDRTNCVH